MTAEPTVYEVVGIPHFTDGFGLQPVPTVVIGDTFTVYDNAPDEDGDWTGIITRTGSYETLSPACIEQAGGVIQVSTLQKFYQGTGMTVLETSAILALLRAMESR